MVNLLAISLTGNSLLPSGQKVSTPFPFRAQCANGNGVAVMNQRISLTSLLRLFGVVFAVAVLGARWSKP